MTTELQMRQGAAVEGIYVPPAEYQMEGPPEGSRFIGQPHCGVLVVAAVIVAAIAGACLGSLV